MLVCRKMVNRLFNFCSGPAMLPHPVLAHARNEIFSIAGSGMSVMEVSHRSDLFAEILTKAENGLRELMEVPQNYRILFLQGGATLQFSMIPMNLLARGSLAEYIINGTWGVKAVAEARKFGNINVVFDGEADGFRRVPTADELSFSPDSAYIHYTSNETIDGLEFPYEIDGHGTPVVCDASSNILSKPFDLTRYALIYAGAQKNIGPSGVTIVILREDLLDHIPDGLPLVLDYRKIDAAGSLLNTPNTWGIYMIGLVCDWLREQGGVEAIAQVNEKKAELLYDAIDSSDGFYSTTVERGSRSRMNVVFRLPTEELDKRFCDEAEQNGMSGLEGHRTVGGIRASIYNAMPIDGVEHLIAFMREFASRSR